MTPAELEAATKAWRDAAPVPPIGFGRNQNTPEAIDYYKAVTDWAAARPKGEPVTVELPPLDRHPAVTSKSDYYFRPPMGRKRRAA